MSVNPAWWAPGGDPAWWAPGGDPAWWAPGGRPVDAPEHRSSARGADGGEREEGSLVTEYGLLAVVAATVAGVVISWASSGALVTLFNALLRHARSLVGA